MAEFYSRMVAAAAAVEPSFEIVFVDDGSPDAAPALVRELCRRDPRVRMVALSRNFGHHPAAMAGLAHSRGERVFIIDVDLEERPEWLVDFWRDFESGQADVVYGVSAERGGGLFKKHTGAAFWKLFNMLSDVRIPENPCTVRLMSRPFVDALLTMPERTLFLAGNYAWLGFRQVGRVVAKGVRPTRTSYTPARLLGLFLDAITSFSSYPLRLIFLIGVAVAGLAMLGGVLLLVRKLLRPEAVALGWSSLIVSIWFLGGVIIAFLGVIGIYLSKIFSETKARPLFVVREQLGGGAAEEAP